ncbi:MAG: DUF1289 domain-containing protein [Phenylobacterium sp.]|uniref:DUF1289 domain-containing protein n=1 Tax=Phenylobacterium sp. TaxID=1871053 RepID=UPI00121B103E|nr:DUF1289 domain-containing protein [Phenylobacterium sp.]TAJ71708.1 MAG: DUF1289 domain-containing protein [Phenylobacterium sp.]
MTVSPERAGPPAPIKTPCIKVCVVDGESGLCLGCYRKLNEVAGWARMTDEERDRVLAELPDRRSLIRPEKLAMF